MSILTGKKFLYFLGVKMNTTHWGYRLREERERLGHSQVNFAALLDISRPSQIAYEKSIGNPARSYWTKIAELGVDIQYVFTGIRSQNWPPDNSAVTENLNKEKLLTALETIKSQSEFGLNLMKNSGLDND